MSISQLISASANTASGFAPPQTATSAKPPQSAAAKSLALPPSSTVAPTASTSIVLSCELKQLITQLVETEGDAAEFIQNFERLYVSNFWPTLLRSQGAVMILLICLKKHRKTLYPIANGSAPRKWAAAAATQVMADFPSAYSSPAAAEKFVRDLSHNLWYRWADYNRRKATRSAAKRNRSEPPNTTHTEVLERANELREKIAQERDELLKIRQELNLKRIDLSENDYYFFAIRVHTRAKIAANKGRAQKRPREEERVDDDVDESTRPDEA